MKLMKLLMISAVAILSIFFLASNSEAKKPVKRGTPHVGDIVYPSSYEGGPCGWQDGDGQPFPVNPYSRSQDWVGQASKIVAVGTSCVTLTPLWPVVPGSYFINWDINHI